MKPARALVGALLISMFSSCSTPPPTAPALPGSGTATVVSVLDGDGLTVLADGQELEVRLDGINAPEIDECFHSEARDHLTSLVGGRVVDLTVSGTDQFGRTLAHIYLDGMHVNLEMVARGMAIATTPPAGDPTELLTAEERVADEGLGLWSPHSCGTGPLPPVEIDFDRSVIDPPGPDGDILHLETVALVNRSDRGVDLEGWTLRDESSRHRFRFPAGTSISPGETVLVSSADPAWSPGGSPVWNNQGDLILLLDDSGRVVARHRYRGRVGLE